MSSQNVCAENFPRAGNNTVPPDARVDSNAAISPWPWYSGITATVASCGPSWYPAMMARTELAMLSCVHGTILGNPVVPPVNMIMASSWRSPSGDELLGFGSVASVQVDRELTSTGRASRPTVTATGHHGTAGSALSPGPCTVDEHHPRARRLASRALLADRQRRIQRDHDQIRPQRRQQRDDEFGVAARAQRHPVTRPQAGRASAARPGRRPDGSGRGR